MKACNPFNFPSCFVVGCGGLLYIWPWPGQRGFRPCLIQGTPKKDSICFGGKKKALAYHSQSIPITTKVAKQHSSRLCLKAGSLGYLLHRGL